jgi:hypothetical protein
VNYIFPAWQARSHSRFPLVRMVASTAACPFHLHAQRVGLLTSVVCPVPGRPFAFLYARSESPVPAASEPSVKCACGMVGP